MILSRNGFIIYRYTHAYVLLSLTFTIDFCIKGSTSEGGPVACLCIIYTNTVKIDVYLNRQDNEMKCIYHIPLDPQT